MNRYLLLGEDACRIMEEDNDLDLIIAEYVNGNVFFGLLKIDSSQIKNINNLPELEGWERYCEITEEEYRELDKRLKDPELPRM